MILVVVAGKLSVASPDGAAVMAVGQAPTQGDSSVSCVPADGLISDLAR